MTDKSIFEDEEGFSIANHARRRVLCIYYQGRTGRDVPVDPIVFVLVGGFEVRMEFISDFRFGIESLPPTWSITTGRNELTGEFFWGIGEPQVLENIDLLHEAEDDSSKVSKLLEAIDRHKLI